MLHLRKLCKSTLAALLLCLVSCGSEGHSPSFVIDGYVRSDHPVREVGLYKLLPEYQKLTLVDRVAVDGGHFRFTGKSPDAAEAFVRLDGDTTAYCFVLTDNRLTMHIDADGSYSLAGSKPNVLLSSLLADRKKMRKEQSRLQGEYRRCVGDSSLTRMIEDSLLRLYRQVGEDYRRQAAKDLAELASAYPATGRLALRMLQSELSNEQVDSLVRQLADSSQKVEQNQKTTIIR